MVAQDIVGAPSYEEAGLLFGQLADDIALYLEQRVVAQVRIIWVGTFRNERETRAEETAQQALGSFLVRLFKKFLAEAAFFGGQVDEFLVVESDS